jgi:predicted lipoprotein with Yx(FWY)xxD motif
MIPLSITQTVRRTWLALGSLVLILLISACGSSASTGSATPPSNTTSPAATTAPAASSAVVQTAQATVGGKTITVFTDAKGLTLYYFTPDTATTTACTTTCGTNWPPLLFSGSGTPTSATSVPGTLSVVNDADGNQVAYSGYLLYTFAGDSKPGDVKGQGIGGKWFVATPDLSAVSVKVSSATVQGKAESILTNPAGLTLYYFTPDTATTSACTGGCASSWPPLISSSTTTPTADAPLTGKLSVVNAANGQQIQYNGHFLYTFASDTKPGDTTGEGVGGKWFVATPDLAA